MPQTGELYPSLDTPAVLVDMDKLEANIAEMSKVAKDAGVKLRPHVKTHKSPFIAHLQLKTGACGIALSRLGNAEVMAENGIDDILITYPIYGEAKLARVKKLLDKAKISIAVDSVEVAQGISRLGQEIRQRIPILLEVDTGFGRCGTPPGLPSLAMAKKLIQLPGVILVGLLTHESARRAFQPVTPMVETAKEVALKAGTATVETVNLLRGEGINLKEITVGSTLTARYIAHVPGVTEIQPGTYVFNDRDMMEFGFATEDSCAVTVLTTVISTPTDDRAIIDAGGKTLSLYIRSNPPQVGYGYVKGRSDLVVERLYEEHGVLNVANTEKKLKIGERLEIIPNGVYYIVSLAEVLYGVRSGVLERDIPVLGRGKSQ